MKQTIYFALLALISCNAPKESEQEVKESPVKQQLASVISSLDSMNVSLIDNVVREYLNEQFIATIDTTQLERSASDQYYESNVLYAREVFFLNSTYDLMMDANPTPTGMMIAENYKRNKTLYLIEKYYQKALAAIKEEYKEVLEKNQLLWKKSQESNIDFNNLILSDEYQGDFSGTSSLYTNYTEAQSRLDFLFSCYMELAHWEY